MTQDAPQQEAPESPRIDTPQAAQALCGELTATIGELVATLDRETSQLKKGRALDTTVLHARKSALTTTLTRKMAVFGRDSQYIAMAAPDQVADIKANQQVFEKSLIANQDALNAMKLVSESLLRTIADKVGETKGGPEVYGGDGHSETAQPVDAPPITIDQNL